jgi:hypothetical protein
MLKLCRLTSEYVEIEDRFRLTGEDEAGNIISLWMTQRLSHRLISYLISAISSSSNEATLNPAQDTDASNLLQGFAQHAATAELPIQKAVDSTLSSQNWLVTEVDINQGEKGILELVFKKEGAESVAIGFDSKQLRQWLSIVRSQWIQAEWSTEIWPSWMATQDEPESSPSQRPVH